MFVVGCRHTVSPSATYSEKWALNLRENQSMTAHSAGDMTTDTHIPQPKPDPLERGRWSEEGGLREWRRVVIAAFCPLSFLGHCNDRVAVLPVDNWRMYRVTFPSYSAVGWRPSRVLEPTTVALGCACRAHWLLLPLVVSCRKICAEKWMLGHTFYWRDQLGGHTRRLTAD